MVSSSFQYFAPTSVAEAVELLEQHGEDAKLLAGGHSLIPLMKLRLAEPQVVIDLGRIGDMAYIREEDGGLAIGAMTTYAQLESSDLVAARAAVLAEAASTVADPQVRNMGTIGGSLSHADPAGDLPAVAIALNARLITSSTGEHQHAECRRLLRRPADHGPRAQRDTQRDCHTRAAGPVGLRLRQVRQQGLALRHCGYSGGSRSGRQRRLRTCEHRRYGGGSGRVQGFGGGGCVARITSRRRGRERGGGSGGSGHRLPGGSPRLGGVQGAPDVRLRSEGDTAGRGKGGIAPERRPYSSTPAGWQGRPANSNRAGLKPAPTGGAG